MPRSKKQSKQMRAESRAKILQAARRLFAAQGYFKCTVSDVAREAGMSQGNIYWYFNSKESLLKAVLKDGFTALGEVLQEAQSQPGTGLEKLSFAVEQYILFAHERGTFTQILMSLMAHGGVPFLNELGFDMLQIGGEYHQSLSPILAQARAEGSVVDVDPHILSMFFFAFMNGLVITYGEDWIELPPELVRDGVLRLLGGNAQ
jgi:AcrR family transcriptional regulator